METRHLRYFRTLAEELHFTRAAILLNVSQAALSHQIQHLEGELGVRLLDRSNRRVRLTEAGEVFLTRAVRILEQMDLATRESVQHGTGVSGSLVIGAVSTAVSSHLPAILREFRRESPNIKVDIREMEPGEQTDALHKETIDVGLLVLAVQDPAFHSALISRERLILALPTGHPAASKGQVSLRDVARDSFLIPRKQSVPGFHELVLATLRGAGVTEPRIQPIRQLNTAVFLVSGQMGLALVPESFRRHLRVRGCVYRDLPGPPVYADLIGVWRRANTPPALRRFIQHLHKTAR